VDKGRRSRRHRLIGSGMLVLGERCVGGVETGVGIGVVTVAETRVRISIRVEIPIRNPSLRVRLRPRRSPRSNGLER
jgi:hypothetical protein